jgi:hypothetical protein
LTGIDSNEVKVELAEYACNVRVESVVTLVNEKEFSDDAVVELNRMAIAEAIENENRIASRLDKFRTANVKIGGKTPNIERVVTVYVKQGTVLKYTFEIFVYSFGIATNFVRILPLKIFLKFF